MTTFRSAFKQLPGMTTLLLCLFMTLPLMTACGGDETGDSASSGGGVEGGDVELFTTAPESLKMLPSGNLSVTISGGKPPYTAMSSDNSVVSVAISGSSLDIRSWLEGNALVNIKDVRGQGVNINIDVASSADARELSTTAPDVLTLQVNESRTYANSGGLAPYSCVSSDNNVLQIVKCQGGEMQIKGLKDGVAQVLIKDARGADSVTFDVNVKNPGLSDVVRVTPSSADWDVSSALCGQLVPPLYSVYFINGGKPPYKVHSSTPQIGSIIGTSKPGNEPDFTIAASVVFGTFEVPETDSGSWFVVAWPGSNGPGGNCATGTASFHIVDSQGLQSGTTPGFTVNIK